MPGNDDGGIDVPAGQRKMDKFRLSLKVIQLLL